MQRVPASSLGATVQIGRAFGESHVVLAGVEGREIRGESDERLFAASGPPFRDAGGEQLLGAARAEDVMRLGPRVTATLGARLDTWSNRAAFRETGAVVERVNGHLELAVEGVQHLNALVDAARARGAMLTELSPVRSTLEDVFVDLVRAPEAPPS